MSEIANKSSLEIMDAKAALDAYWDGSLPIDPAKLARRAGASVVADPRMREKDLSGSFDLTASGPLITVNPSDAKVRQRFTVAHELGHMFLKHGAAFRDNARNYTSAALLKEREANNFAAELLMPAEVLQWLIQKKDLTSITALAQALNVSGAAMEYRLKNLGLLRRR
ncbi:ImmA/IrrE family metallo-endopeptidase [Pelagibacterium sp.]|uniref:ImmA/IrrE family metallo-endopeptidase n=1 Tax=Pelagibacterium sp. TaxID=1967288 RepID=UPI003A8FBF0F